MTRHLKHLSIGQRTLLLFAVPLLLVILALGYRITSGYMADARNALDIRGGLLARQFAALCEFGLYAEDLSELRKQSEAVMQEEDVAGVQVSNDAGEILVRLGYEDTANHGSDLASFQAPVVRTGVNISDFESESTVVETGNADPAAVIGHVTVSLSTARLLQKLRDIVMAGSILTISGLLASILLAYIVALSISTPIRHLTAIVEKLTGGDLDARCQQGSPGELGSLETGINQMADSLQDAQDKLIGEVEAATVALQGTVTELEAKNIELDLARNQAVRAAKAKLDFLARMSHEIRTPLNAIIGFNELLGKTRLSENQQEYIRTVSQAASQLLLVIEDILGYTRLESDTLKLEQTSFNLHDCLENVVSMLVASAHEKQLELVLYIHSDVPQYITSDPNRISQVLTNLAANAIKFTRRGHVVIDVSLLDSTADSVTVRVAVSDTGMGLSDSQLEQIFDPFIQADVSISREYGGTGLGLSISKKLVELLGGKITVSSRQGSGSTFSFTIPSQRVDGDNALPKYHLAGSKVLVYDSNPFSLRALRNRFITWGASVFNTSDRDRLQQMLDDTGPTGKHYDLLVMGLSYKEFDKQSCNDMCREYKTGMTLPTLFVVSAEIGEPAPDSDCMANCRVLTKPARSDLLLRTVRSLLKLPDKPAAESVTAATAVRPDAAESLAGLDVLVVEDNRFNRDLFSRLLEDHGVTATLAIDGREACKLAGAHRYDIIFMDIHMPVMGGIEATANIRQGVNRLTPVIALTADVFTEQQHDLVGPGVDDCLYKPVSDQKLVDMLQRWRHPGARARPGPDTAGTTRDADAPETAQACICLTPEFRQRLREELDTGLQALRKAYATGDQTALQEQLHQLKGVVDYFKLDEFSTAFRTLHTAILSRHTATVNTAIDRLEVLLAGKTFD